MKVSTSVTVEVDWPVVAWAVPLVSAVMVGLFYVVRVVVSAGVCPWT